MKYFYCFGICLFIVFLFFNCNSMTYQVSNDEKIVNQITAKTAKKLKEKKDLVLIGTGGQMMYDIQMLAMSFNYYHEVDLETARNLLVESVEEYLADINSNQEIRSYLHEYPFTAKNVEIVIFFRNCDGSNVATGKINIAAADQGQIDYYIDYPENHTIKSIYEEPYEKATRTIFSK